MNWRRQLRAQKGQQLCSRRIYEGVANIKKRGAIVGFGLVVEAQGARARVDNEWPRELVVAYV